MKSIISSKKECYICHTNINLHIHHIFYGRNRKNSDKDGLVVYLCQEHHMGNYGIHGKYGHSIDLYLKRIGQKAWQDYYNKTKEDFLKEFKKNYL